MIRLLLSVFRCRLAPAVRAVVALFSFSRWVLAAAAVAPVSCIYLRVLSLYCHLYFSRRVFRVRYFLLGFWFSSCFFGGYQVPGIQLEVSTGYQSVLCTLLLQCCRNVTALYFDHRTIPVWRYDTAANAIAAAQ